MPKSVNTQTLFRPRSWSLCPTVDTSPGPQGQKPMFLFKINPLRVDFSKPKGRVLDLTKAGYQNIFWGSKETDLTISGSSQVFAPGPAGGIITNVFGSLSQQNMQASNPSGSFDITLTSAWSNFFSLKKYFESYSNAFYHLFTDDFQMYVGILDDFSFVQDANDPFRITYGFIFKAFVRQKISVSGSISGSSGPVNLRATIKPTIKISSSLPKVPLYSSTNSWGDNAV